MKVKDPHFILEKIRKYLDEDIKPSRYRSVVEIGSWKYMETSMDERIDEACAPDYDDSGWADFRLWDTWGGYDRAAWFRTVVRIPEEIRSFQGKECRIALRFLVGPRDGGDSTAETLLYIDGKPVQGIDIWHEEALLDDAVTAKNAFQIALKAWSGVLAPPRFRTFKLAQMIALDERVEHFYYTADTLLRCCILLDENDLRRIRLTRLLNDTFKRVHFLNFGEEEYYASVYDALSFVEKGLGELAATEEIKPVVYGVGHSHIYMAWLWRLCATREKASRTFSTVLNLMRQYPEYRYMHSSPQLYQFLKEDYPDIYEQVREKIQEGSWEITGGMWVEPDTNIPSGESLVRQFVYGKRFIREEFGRETTLVWLPDVFGYSAAMPQIMKKSGMKYFMTTKISWNQYNQFPYDTFWWKGIDGTKIFTHFITTPEDGSWFYTYNGHMDPEEVMGVWNNYKDKDKNDELLIAFGWGDGGGGPTREMLEQSRVMKNIPGIPKVELTTAEDYFRRIYDHVDHDALGQWEGELYFELHRGTYTSQAANKRYNRQAEILLHNIECLSVLSGMEQECAYPKEALDALWERVLLNQFHDILPGSSIRQVYEDTAEDYAHIAKKGGELLGSALSGILKTVHVAENSVVICNTAGYQRSDYVQIPYSDSVDRDTVLIGEQGVLRCQATEQGILAYVEKIPAYGYCSLKMQQGVAAGDADMRIAPDGAENRFYLLKLNDNGEIIYLYDKENDRTVSCGQPMNVFTAYEDKPQRFDAWDVDVYYREKPYQKFSLVSSTVIENGSARAVLRQVWTFNRSTLTQDMILYADIRRIDFQTTVDWKEKQVFLKAYFPVAVHSDEVTYDIQFGSIRRPTHTNNEWDFARFEVPGHKWADLSEGGYGVALLNDCKYGWDIHGNVIGLSLIKSAVHPDETADRGRHVFAYALYPHRGDLSQSDVEQMAYSLNMPLLVSERAGEPGGQEYAAFGMVSTDCRHVMLETLKQSEDGKAVVVRLYEYRNQSENNVCLRFAHRVRAAAETNLCEEGETWLDVEDNQIHFGISGFEIKTFKLYFERCGV